MTNNIHLYNFSKTWYSGLGDPQSTTLTTELKRYSVSVLVFRVSNNIILQPIGSPVIASLGIYAEIASLQLYSANPITRNIARVATFAIYLRAETSFS